VVARQILFICNREIKWGDSFERPTPWGSIPGDRHYARVRFDMVQRRYVVSKSVNVAKDQSYALWAFRRMPWRKRCFLLAHMKKAEVRELARRYGLRNAAKEESFEICFVADTTMSVF